jgi:hypothetical protein
LRISGNSTLAYTVADGEQVSMQEVFKPKLRMGPNAGKIGPKLRMSWWDFKKI